MGWLGNNLGNANSGATGYVRQVFTSNGTWSCCTGAQRINVIAIGGGGGGYSGGLGGSGGSGKVTIKYADSFDLAASTTGSPTIQTTGGFRVYTFTGSGTITF